MLRKGKINSFDARRVERPIMIMTQLINSIVIFADFMASLKTLNGVVKIATCYSEKMTVVERIYLVSSIT